MKVYLIEPHFHYEMVLGFLLPAVEGPFPIHLVTVKKVWEELQSWAPQILSKIEYTPISKWQRQQPEPGLLVFTSMQSHWKSWLPLVKNNPSVLVIYNGNMYFRPQQAITNTPGRGPLWKHLAKIARERWLHHHHRQNILQSLTAVTAYSPLQEPFFEKFSPIPARHFYAEFPFLPSAEDRNFSLCPFSRFENFLDIDFLQKSIPQLKNKIVLLHSPGKKNYLKEIIRPSLRDRQKLIGYRTPVSRAQYYELFAHCSEVIVPIQKTVTSNIFRETIGYSKGLFRLLLPKLLQKPLLLPAAIPRETFPTPTNDRSERWSQWVQSILDLHAQNES